MSQSSVKCQNCGRKTTGDHCQWCGYPVIRHGSRGKKFFLIMALVLALVLSGGTFAYTYTTTSSTIGAVPAEADIATVEKAANQPDWESVLTPVTKAETLRPNAPGDKTEISDQYPATGEHWDKVDDETPDEWETYVYHPGSDYGKDLYNLPALSGSGMINKIINKITVYFRFSGDSLPAGDKIGYAKALIKTHGAVYEGSEESQTGKTFVTKSEEWITNPNTGEAWTWDEIDNLQIGLELKGEEALADYAYCTQVYCEVDYQYVPLYGEVPTGNLCIVTPDPAYTGDLQVKVYLTNTGNLTKAYQYLNMKLYLEGSVEAPDCRLLTLENGVATFNLENCAGSSHTLSVIGGSYCLVEANTWEWREGWSVTPEFYYEVEQR